VASSKGRISEAALEKEQENGCDITAHSIEAIETMNPDSPPEKHASRLAVDQARFRYQQNARTQALGVTINWTVRWDRAEGFRQWTWDDRTDTKTTRYALWSADVQENGDIVVTRTEYGYLRNEKPSAPGDAEGSTSSKSD